MTHGGDVLLSDPGDPNQDSLHPGIQVSRHLVLTPWPPLPLAALGAGSSGEGKLGG